MTEANHPQSGATTERLIALAAPFLDLVMALGDRVSRIAEPVDYEYYPIRPASERELPERTSKPKARQRGQTPGV